MKLGKILFAAAAAAVMLVASAASALAYEGGWYYDNNPTGWEQLSLGDNSDDTYLHLEGTELYCGRPGASYAKMRSVIGNEYDQITWWIANECDNTVRICVRNSYGEQACSTYWWLGWENYR